MKYGWYVVYTMVLLANDCIMMSRIGEISTLELLILGFGPILCFLAGKWIYKKEE